jgi:hypothetical protein
MVVGKMMNLFSDDCSGNYHVHSHIFRGVRVMSRLYFGYRRRAQIDVTIHTIFWLSGYAVFVHRHPTMHEAWDLGELTRACKVIDG